MRGEQKQVTIPRLYRTWKAMQHKIFQRIREHYKTYLYYNSVAIKPHYLFIIHYKNKKNYYFPFLKRFNTAPSIPIHTNPVIDVYYCLFGIYLVV